MQRTEWRALIHANDFYSDLCPSAIGYDFIHFCCLIFLIGSYGRKAMYAIDTVQVSRGINKRNVQLQRKMCKR